MKVLLCLVVLVLGKLSDASNDDADYGDQAGWGGVCVSGSAQSPIDIISPEKSTEVEATSLISLPNGAEDAAMTNMDNPNTIKFHFPSSLTYSVFGMTDVTATLEQVHLHWGDTNEGSEHCLNGVRNAAEAHLVTSYTEASTTKYVVVARLFEVGAENAQVAEMIAASESTSSRDLVSFNASALYPSDIDDILQYSGSLTTPGCDEVVTWFVVPKLLTISTDQLAALRVLKLGDGTGAVKASNWRAAQDLNSRDIVCYVLKSSSASLVISPLLLLLAAIAKML